jgi:hypothetical protein
MKGCDPVAFAFDYLSTERVERRKIADFFWCGEQQINALSYHATAMVFADLNRAQASNAAGDRARWCMHATVFSW